jgi:glycosyltransferase involved in cell wall biosynthesis
LKISIITTSFNSASTIEKTIQSVIKQSYKNIEFIIIDNCSTDGTLDIIKKYKAHISKLIVEKDKGISEAFNKGVKVSSGDFINFLGSDDYFWNDTVIEKVVQEIGNRNNILFCGQIARVSKNEELIYITKIKHFKKYLLLKYMPLPHQGLFTPSTFFKDYGYFDENVKYSMDYDLLLRAYHNFPNVLLSKEIISAWREGGIGDNRHLEVLNEYNKIKLKNKIAPKLILKLIHFWIIFKYRIKNYLKFIYFI